MKSKTASQGPASSAQRPRRGQPITDDSHARRYEQARAAYARADCVLGAEALRACYARMAKQIEARFGGRNPVILCVMLGGLHPTAAITQILSFAFELDYLHATRYRGATEGGDLVWNATPDTPLAGRHVLVIDDILDEGHTLAAIRAALEGHGAASLTTAILLQKRHDRRRPDVTADILGREVEDRYLFGAGMDYRGYFRQLPAVYAINPETATPQP